MPKPKIRRPKRIVLHQKDRCQLCATLNWEVLSTSTDFVFHSCRELKECAALDCDFCILMIEDVKRVVGVDWDRLNRTSHVDLPITFTGEYAWEIPRTHVFDEYRSPLRYYALPGRVPFQQSQTSELKWPDGC